MTQKISNRKISQFYLYSGQVVIIMLLVSVVVLTFILAVVSQTISGLRRTEEIAESNRAFVAAEAGIEEALWKVATDVGPTSVPDPVVIPGSDSSYRYSFYTRGGADEFVFSDFPLSQDEVLQVDLTGTGGEIAIVWGEETITDPDQQASLVLTFVSEDGTGGYTMKKEAFNPPGVARNNGFDTAATCAIEDCGSTDLLYKTLDINTNDYLPIPGQGERILRIRAMYNRTHPALIGIMTQGYILLTQYEEIVSIGASGDTQRAVKVVYSKPFAPVLFDYGLFSGGSQNLWKLAP